MRNILYKEIKLSAHILSFFFILFGLMFLLPGYPILVGAFFVTFGIYQSFQNARETNDILFSVLLPIAKKDVVKGKYMFVCLIELCALLIMTLIVILRMTLLVNVVVYRNNFLMNANFFALSLAFTIFALFNAVFVCGYFKTTYKIGKSFIIYTILSFIVVTIGESLHHFPGLEVLNSFGNSNLTIQLILLLLGILFYIIVTYISYRKSCVRFERIDL